MRALLTNKADSLSSSDQLNSSCYWQHWTISHPSKIALQFTIHYWGEVLDNISLLIMFGAMHCLRKIPKTVHWIRASFQQRKYVASDRLFWEKWKNTQFVFSSTASWKKTTLSSLLRLYYKTLWNLNCHRLSKEGSLTQSDVQSFVCPTTAGTEIFAGGHNNNNNLDLVQRFLPELVFGVSRFFLAGFVLLICWDVTGDIVSWICRSDLLNQETSGRWSLRSLTSETGGKWDLTKRPRAMKITITAYAGGGAGAPVGLAFHST